MFLPPSGPASANRASGICSSDARGVSTSTHGACLCGAVTFAIAPPYRWFAHCHCSLCRKHHGSLFGTGLGVAREQARSGSHAARRRRSCTTARRRRSSGRFAATAARRSRRSRTTSAFWHVPAGLLDGDPGARPRSHIFVALAVAAVRRSTTHCRSTRRTRREYRLPTVDTERRERGTTRASSGQLPLRSRRVQR